ncbi:neuroglobin-like [Aphis craccivora]|uniref:Neuroglobin-like n=1 Tax=Aphis craccivora TaxID=307492 RepID=A0A6G0ZKY6_APHCR|nr:neuroglobin-like [Aphis craccivora]
MNKIEVPFLEAVKTTLGDRFTENIETIYKITIKLIIETLIKGYTEAAESNYLIMVLLQQSLRERLVAFVSICPETLDGDQSVYKRIVDQLQDLQRFHQELIRTAESGVSEDPKTFESKQKGILTMSTGKGPSTTPQ